MWKRTTLLLLLFSLPMTGTVRADVAAGTATVEFALKPCPLVVAHPFSGGTLTYQIWGDGGDVTKKLSWSSGDVKPLRLTLQLAPGAYAYDVIGQRVSRNRPNVGCQAFQYFAVLPGDTRHVDDEMLDCCGDPVSALFLDGVASPSMRIRVVRFDGSPACDTPLSGLTTHPIAVEQTSIGYYARDVFVSASDKGSAAVFGIEVQRASGESRTFRVAADYPTEFISAPPKLARLDVTETVVSGAFEKPPGTLLCSGPDR